jgi:prolyl oligopeptidase PreP (S9A serine peptidase family)
MLNKLLQETATLFVNHADKLGKEFYIELDMGAHEYVYQRVTVSRFIMVAQSAEMAFLRVEVKYFTDGWTTKEVTLPELLTWEEVMSVMNDSTIKTLKYSRKV